MATCPSCSREVVPNSKYCPNCGSSIADLAAAVTAESVGWEETVAAPPSVAKPVSRPSSFLTNEIGARFTPGTVLVDRFRIVAPLGRGGMGEVYRADDLKLGQQVALKFLPQSVGGDAAALQQLVVEVRTARQVAHPNVCRVYDIGELTGQDGRVQAFLSMEFVDGEDLASLLRRIGRLPGDTAARIGRQVCLGLYALHEAGLIHRDLKPANIMLDGRGNVRITDFGLAGLVEQVKGSRAGTPAYMAPELFAQTGAASVASDNYALGLVLYELFTGRQPFTADTVGEIARKHERTPPPSPSGFVPDIDPEVEAVIMRCLEKDPAKRPGSALAVAGALPGGDALSAAAAAGETPLPEQVAAAEERGGLSAGMGVALLAATLVCIGLIAYLNDTWSMFGRIGMAKAPAVLVERGRDIIKSAGYTEPPVDSAWGFFTDSDYLHAVQDYDQRPGRWRRTIDGRMSAIQFWYRQAQAFLDPQEGELEVTPAYPAPVRAGMASVRLSPSGRLLAFRAVPGAADATRDGAVDWSPLLKAAELDDGKLKPAEPAGALPVMHDERAAWEFADVAPDDETAVPLRVEAGAMRGRPVYFAVLPAADAELSFEWLPPEDEAGVDPESARTDLIYVLGVAVPVVVAPLVGAAWLARRNLRNGRGDRRGAVRVALAIGVTGFASWLLAGDLATAGEQWGRTFAAIGDAMMNAAIMAMVYIALEPLLRREWTRTLIGWTRALAGRFGDPMVGRDLLLGAALGAAWVVGVQLLSIPQSWFGAAAGLPRGIWTIVFSGPLVPVANVADAIQNGLGWTLVYAVAMLLVRGAMPHAWRWVGRVLFVVLVILLGALVAVMLARLDGRIEIQHWLGGWATSVLLFALLPRIGLLATAAALSTGIVLVRAPLTLDLSRWYAPGGVVCALAVIAAALWGFRGAVMRGRAVRP